MQTLFEKGIKISERKSSKVSRRKKNYRLFSLSFHLQHNYLIKDEKLRQANYTKKTIQA